MHGVSYRNLLCCITLLGVALPGCKSGIQPQYATNQPDTQTAPSGGIVAALARHFQSDPNSATRSNTDQSTAGPEADGKDNPLIASLSKSKAQDDSSIGMVDGVDESLDPKLQKLAQQQLAAMKDYQASTSKAESTAAAQTPNASAQPTTSKQLTLPRPGLANSNLAKSGLPSTNLPSAALPAANTSTSGQHAIAQTAATAVPPSQPATAASASNANVAANATAGASMVRQADGSAFVMPNASANPIQQTAATAPADGTNGPVALATGNPGTSDTMAGAANANDANNNLTTIDLTSHSVPSNAPLPTSPASASEHLDALIAHYANEQPDIDTPQGLQQLTKLRLLYLLSDDPDKAMSKVSGLSAAEQDFMRYQMMTLWTLMDPDGSPSRTRRWDKSLENLRLASGHLAASTESLDVAGMAFCTEVESFGRIKPFKDYKLQAGQQVILYCEIDNFAAERLSDGYETHFQGSYDIFDSQGIRVAEQVLPADKQSCNNFRRDYFIAYRMYLPKQLQTGPHRVQLTIEDLKGKKFGQASLDFEIVASTTTPEEK